MGRRGVSFGKDSGQHPEHVFGDDPPFSSSLTYLLPSAPLLLLHQDFCVVCGVWCVECCEINVRTGNRVQDAVADAWQVARTWN